MVRLNRAIATSHVAGPERALADVDALQGDLDRYQLFHATRAELLRELGQAEDARLADRRALELTENPARANAAAAPTLLGLRRCRIPRRPLVILV